VPTLDAAQKAALLRHAENAADDLVAATTGATRARIGGPTYSAADLRRGGWSAKVTALGDDVEVAAVRVFVDGSQDVVDVGETRRQAPAIPPALQDVAGAEDNAGVVSDADGGL